MKPDKALSITSPNNYLLEQEYADHRKVVINNILFALPLQCRYAPVLITCHLLKCACLQALWKSLIRAEIGGRLCSKWLKAPFPTDAGFSKARREHSASFSSSFAVLSLSFVAAGMKGMQSHALVCCPSASLFTLHSSTWMHQKRLFLRLLPLCLLLAEALLRGTVSLI